MSRIRTDLRPAMGANKRSPTKSLPPVRSPRVTRTPELDWEADMVQSLQVRAVSPKLSKTLTGSLREPVHMQRESREQKSRAPRSTSPHDKALKEENTRLRNEIEKLKAKIASLQKIIEALRVEVNDKSVNISELEQQLRIQAEKYEKQVEKLKYAVTESRKETEELKKKLKESNEEKKMMKQDFDREKDKMKDEFAQQLASMSAAHQEELNEKVEKLKLLKMRMADALGDNSRERQQQLEELTRELKRVTEESGVIKSKLMSIKSSNQGKCQNCFGLEKQLQSKILEVKDQQVAVLDLQQLCSKMERQLMQQDELLRQWAKSQGKSIK